MTGKIDKKRYYIASAKCYQVKAYNGNISTDEDTVVWLGMSEGYPSCTTLKNGAKKFTSSDKIKETAKNWDGMPWYYRLKPGTIRIYEVIKSTNVEIIETETILDDEPERKSDAT